MKKVCTLYGPCHWVDPDWAGGQPGAEELAYRCEYCDFGRDPCPDCGGPLEPPYMICRDCGHRSTIVRIAGVEYEIMYGPYQDWAIKEYYHVVIIKKPADQQQAELEYSSGVE